MDLIEKLEELPKKYDKVVLDTSIFCYNKKIQDSINDELVIPRIDYYDMLYEIIKDNDSIVVSKPVFNELKAGYHAKQKNRKYKKEQKNRKTLLDYLSGYQRILEHETAKNRMNSYKPSSKEMQDIGLSNADISAIHMSNYFANTGLKTSLVTNDKLLGITANTLFNNLIQYSRHETEVMNIYSQIKSGSNILILNNDKETRIQAINQLTTLQF